MNRYCVVARDPTIDLYRESDLYGAEVVDAESPEEAERLTSFADLQGLFVTVTECNKENPLGECDLSVIIF